MSVRDESIPKLRQRRDQLRADLAAVGDMRPGSLVARYRRCGKPNCRCARAGDRGHGPSFSLTHAVNGKTVTKIIPRRGGGPNAATYRRVPAFPGIGPGGGRRQRALMRCGVEADRWAGLERDGEKGGFKTAFAVEIAAEIATLIGAGAVEDWDFEALETAIRRQAMGVAARAVEQRINADTSDGDRPAVRCGCGGPARYVDRRWKRFHSVLGVLKLERAYYHCGVCGAGVCPRDRVLGLEGGSLSPAVLRMVGRVGAMVSFEEGHELLAELAGVEVSAKHVERAAEALGREVAQDETQAVEPLSDSETVPPTLYLGMDGTGVPVRKDELVGRTGKQPDGSARTREVKLVTIWSAQTRDKNGVPERDPGSISYSAAIESAAQKDTDDMPSAFAARVQREAVRRGFDDANRRVVLGDGAKWIWNLAAEYLPDAIQIVDRFHAKQHLADVASPSTAPVVICAHNGPVNVTTSWMLGISTRSCHPYSGIRRKMRRPANASTTSRTTAIACATLNSGPRDSVPPQASSRPDARPSSVYAANELACIGPWPAPTPSSPCAAPCSAAASRTSGNDALNTVSPREHPSSHNPVVRPACAAGPIFGPASGRGMR